MSGDPGGANKVKHGTVQNILNLVYDPITQSLRASVDTTALGMYRPVLSRIDMTSAEPADPTIGDRVLNTGTGVSSVTAQAVTVHNIYEWNGTTWTETVPVGGKMVVVTDEDVVYVFDGLAWFNTFPIWQALTRASPSLGPGNLVASEARVQGHRAPVQVISLIDDLDKGGVDPVAPNTGDAYVRNNWASGADGDIVNWDSSAWAIVVVNDTGEVPAGTRAVIAQGAAGSFSGQDGDIMIRQADSTYEFVTPDNGDTARVVGTNAVYQFQEFMYDAVGTDWELSHSFEIANRPNGFYASENNLSGIEDGTEENPYFSLQDAHDNAPDNSLIYIDDTITGVNLTVSKSLRLKNMSPSSGIQTIALLTGTGFPPLTVRTEDVSIGDIDDSAMTLGLQLIMSGGSLSPVDGGFTAASKTDLALAFTLVNILTGSDFNSVIGLTQLAGEMRTFSNINLNNRIFKEFSGEVALYDDGDSPLTPGSETNLRCNTSGGVITVNLPPVANVAVGREFRIKRWDAGLGNNLTIDADGSEEIDGSLTYVLTAAYESVTLVSDGVGWMVV